MIASIFFTLNLVRSLLGRRGRGRRFVTKQVPFGRRIVGRRGAIEFLQVNRRINRIDVNRLLATSLSIIRRRLRPRRFFQSRSRGLSRGGGVLALPVVDRVNDSENEQDHTNDQRVHLLPVLNSEFQNDLPQAILNGLHIRQYGEVQTDEIGVILARSQPDRVNYEYMVAALNRINEFHNIRVGPLHGESDLDLEQA